MPRPNAPIPVGVSACLTGARVRFDGGHKASSLPRAALQGLFDYRPFCPEVAIGLVTPRKPIRLIAGADGPQAVGPIGDVTTNLDNYARSIEARLLDLDGFIFVKGSPSCGLHREKVFNGDGELLRRDGRGIFAHTISLMFPLLPMEEAGRLCDPVLRENFVTRALVHARWRATLVDEDLTAQGLIAFHSAHKYLVMAHDVSAYRTLGRMLSNLKTDLPETARAYMAGLMTALSKPASRGGHANVLSHLQGYVKRKLVPAARAELACAIESYRRGETPLLAPVTLLRHHLAQHEVLYALEQVYLDPHPAASGLRREL